MPRRQWFHLMASGLLSMHALARQTAAPQFGSLDHIEFYVANSERSRDFYAGVFGNTVLSRQAKRYIKLGSAYMAFEPPRANTVAASVDHISLSVKGLEMPRLHAFLQESGIPFQDYPSGRDTAVIDPDGSRLQLSPENGWGLLNPPNFVPETVALSAEPIFKPLAMDHVMLQISDMERAVAFYQKILGPPAERTNTTTWFGAGKSRLGVMLTPSGQKPGVRHFAVSVASFDVAKSSRLLQQMGAKVEYDRSPSWMEFRDPDGLRLLVAMPA